MAKAAKGLKGMSQQEAISSLNEAELPLYEDLKTTFDRKSGDDIRWYWGLGRKVAEIHKDTADKEGTVYGEKLILRLAKSMGMASDSSFYSAMHVVEVWPTEDSFGGLVEMRGTKDNRLSWSHIVLLSNVPKAEDRLAYAAAALEECWSTDQLLQQIQDRYGKADNRRGRAPRRPTSLSNCLSHMASSSNKLVNLMENAWLGKNYSFVQSFRETPPDDVDIALASKISEARKVMDKLINKATEIYTALTELEDASQSHVGGSPADAESQEDTFPVPDEEPDSDAIPLRRRRTERPKRGKRGRSVANVGLMR